MGQPHKPPKVKLFIIALSADDQLLEEIHRPLENAFGKIEETTISHPWDFSPAYVKELGENIKRRFFVFEELREIIELPDWKLITNKIERQISSTSHIPIKRRINLDPGYLHGSQVILASTKRYNNRVYLRDGIYGDLTLYFDGKSFRPLKNLTFPDYQTVATLRFFNQLRRRYLAQNKSIVANDISLETPHGNVE